MTAISNSVYGLAFGDAWGHRLEFLPHDKIMIKPRPFPERPQVTDDTQMALYAMRAIISNSKRYFTKFYKDPSQKNADNVRKAFMDEFIHFGDDPDNNRAPGLTCMGAIHRAKANYKDMEDGQEFTNWNSKGCGANMRNPWFGLLDLSREQIAYLSVLQCETTHSHPLALASAIVTALCVKDVAKGLEYFQFLDGIDWIQKISSEAREYDYGRSTKNVVQGLDELIEFVESKRDAHYAFLVSDNDKDISLYLGQGWVAEEALLNAVGALERYGINKDVEGMLEGLERLVCSSGDSDSIAAIGGAMLGYNLDEDEELPHWENRLETRYQKELSVVIGKLEKDKKDVRSFKMA
jgi:ADP-ribosylglycohydrolase